MTSAPLRPQVSQWYTLVIFTASMQEYADPVIDWLDAGRGILGRRLFREVSDECCLTVSPETLTERRHRYSHVHSSQMGPTRKICR